MLTGAATQQILSKQQMYEASWNCNTSASCRVLITSQRMKWTHYSLSILGSCQWIFQNTKSIVEFSCLHNQCWANKVADKVFGDRRMTVVTLLMTELTNLWLVAPRAIWPNHGKGFSRLDQAGLSIRPSLRAPPSHLHSNHLFPFPIHQLVNC